MFVNQKVTGALGLASGLLQAALLEPRQTPSTLRDREKLTNSDDKS